MRAQHRMVYRNAEMRQFCRFEGRLATDAIVRFIDRASEGCKGTLLDLGCGGKPYRRYFQNVDEYVGIDLAEGACVDIVADATSVPLSDGYADVILCTQLLEHLSAPEVLLSEARRLLKSGGQLLLTAPQMGRLHGEPNDYYRYTKWGLRHLLARSDFEIVEIESQGGAARALGSHLNFFFIETLGRRRVLRSALRHSLIRANNIVLGSADRIILWNKDTLGYNVLAIRRP